jgi:predicted secreted Zn-dependent protease
MGGHAVSPEDRAISMYCGHQVPPIGIGRVKFGHIFPGHWAGIVLIGALISCTPIGERTQMSVAYYEISGQSFDEIDQQIAVHGPSVLGVGRALAATNVRMIPDFHFEHDGTACRPAEIRVSVQAHVTLPKLASQETLRAELSKAWDNLEQYTRLHEYVHVSIADSHALIAEEAIRALPPKPTCTELRAAANGLFKEKMAAHQIEQLRFDQEERGRIAALVQNTRLESRPKSF